jgi:4'-phosphopantetheinyl transferase
MSRDNSAWSGDYFSTVSRDLTPASLDTATHVLFAPLSRDSRVSLRCTAVLSDNERRRAQRFAGEEERSRYIQRRAFRRFCAARALELPGSLSRSNFAETAKGRPYLHGFPEFWCSLSARRVGVLGAWSSTHGIGVDLEDDTRCVEAVDLSRRYFCAAEKRAIQRLTGPERLRTFFQYWCLKEAALKSIGEGLPSGLDAFEFGLRPDPLVLRAPPDHGGAERFDAHLIDGTGYCAALVLRSPA